MREVNHHDPAHCCCCQRIGAAPEAPKEKPSTRKWGYTIGLGQAQQYFKVLGKYSTHFQSKLTSKPFLFTEAITLYYCSPNSSPTLELYIYIYIYIYIYVYINIYTCIHRLTNNSFFVDSCVCEKLYFPKWFTVSNNNYTFQIEKCFPFFP